MYSKNSKTKKCYLRILYAAKLSFLYEGKIRTFSDKENLQKFATNKPLLQEILYFLSFNYGYTLCFTHTLQTWYMQL